MLCVCVSVVMFVFVVYACVLYAFNNKYILLEPWRCECFMYECCGF